MGLEDLSPLRTLEKAGLTGGGEPIETCSSRTVATTVANCKVNVTAISNQAVDAFLLVSLVT